MHTLCKSLAYLWHIFVISLADLGHILSISWACHGHIFGKSFAYCGHILILSMAYPKYIWAYLGPTFGVSYAYLMHILNISWENFGHILRINQAHLVYKVFLFFPFEIQEIGSNMLSNVSPSLGFAVRLYRINQVSCGILNQH